MPSRRHYLPLHRARFLAALAIFLCSGPLTAGPPFLTDDPEPTDNGHWEIYAPYSEADGANGDVDGAVGAEVNYGPAPNLQISLDLPFAYHHDSGGWRTGTGDISVSAKYRVYRGGHNGLSIAVYPAITIPTARRDLGAGRLTAFLPVWVQKDSGPWSVFGGGGLVINPGVNYRNFWKAGFAVTRNLGERLQLGIEAYRQGGDAVGRNGTTRIGAGITYQLNKSLRLLGSGGPTLSDTGGAAGYHAFLALGMEF